MCKRGVSIALHKVSPGIHIEGNGRTDVTTFHQHPMAVPVSPPCTWDQLSECSEGDGEEYDYCQDPEV